MALAALANFSLVLFNISYIPFRDFYLNRLPQITELYDPVKGIEPYRDTQQYLDTVDQIEKLLAESGPEGAKLQQLLTQIEDQSEAMINENPFELANKTGTLEKIKNRMREHMGQESARGSFREFWSIDHLKKNLWTREIKFFNEDIRPLIASNYYRPFGESGDFVDYFVAIDFPFVLLFGFGLFSENVLFKSSPPRYQLARYDFMAVVRPLLFLAILAVPAEFFPITLRLHQVGWINLSRNPNPN